MERQVPSDRLQHALSALHQRWFEPPPPSLPTVCPTKPLNRQSPPSRLSIPLSIRRPSPPCVSDRSSSNPSGRHDALSHLRQGPLIARGKVLPLIFKAFDGLGLSLAYDRLTVDQCLSLPLASFFRSLPDDH
ncbi:hypothetical protein [Absidia glauca]|uniref:Uncharacterized protein n=1 Tax=Absidia glauca TaxID=4829 RepID=A0A163ITN7_ABSGL|nr:hypothetical protein [Absidia glauca]